MTIVSFTPIPRGAAERCLSSTATPEMLVGRSAMVNPTLHRRIEAQHGGVRCSDWLGATCDCTTGAVQEPTLQHGEANDGIHRSHVAITAESGSDKKCRGCGEQQPE